MSIWRDVERKRAAAAPGTADVAGVVMAIPVLARIPSAHARHSAPAYQFRLDLRGGTQSTTIRQMLEFTETHIMKKFFLVVCGIVAVLGLASESGAQPPGITREMIASALPVEGAPLAEA